MELVTIGDQSRGGVGGEVELRRGYCLAAETISILISLLQQVRDKGAMVAYGSQQLAQCAQECARANESRRAPASFLYEEWKAERIERTEIHKRPLLVKGTVTIQ